MRQIAFIALLISATISFAQWTKNPLKVPSRPDPTLYRADARPQKEIAQAIAQSGKENKRILLVFGATWCADCYALEYGFHQPRVEPVLNASFKVVHIDVGRPDKNLDLAKKYRIDPEKGIPALAVLSSRGVLLYSTKEFDRARLMTDQDILDFLNTWKPPARK